MFRENISIFRGEPMSTQIKYDSEDAMSRHATQADMLKAKVLRHQQEIEKLEKLEKALEIAKSYIREEMRMGIETYADFPTCLKEISEVLNDRR